MKRDIEFLSEESLVQDNEFFLNKNSSFKFYIKFLFLSSDDTNVFYKLK